MKKPINLNWQEETIAAAKVLAEKRSPRSLSEISEALMKVEIASARACGEMSRAPRKKGAK